MATVGLFRAAAKCEMPESLPIKRLTQLNRAASSVMGLSRTTR
jgi:hypothetical protein